ncbi:MAG: response regulator transcription factor [Verrucomicrobiae bacterium]|nr:response regulator transcription factor [Verrucomicrobiae bacterium]
MSTALEENVLASCRIFVVDDHPLVRDGLRRLLESKPGWTLCGETPSALQAISEAPKARPDILVIDILLDDGDGIELTKNLRALLPAVPILILSMYDEAFYAERALRAGAQGFLMKTEASENIVAAIEQILRGELYVSPGLGKSILKRLAKPVSSTDAEALQKLSDREWAVFRLIGEGHGTRRIAEKLRISVKTVETYREHLKSKLGLKSGADLLHHAVQWMRNHPRV